MSKNKIIIGIVVVALLLLGVFLLQPQKLGGSVHLIAEQFVNGVVVGSSAQPGCIKIADRDADGGFTYVTFQDGVQYVTGGTAAALASNLWQIPSACTEPASVDLRSR